LSERMASRDQRRDLPIERKFTSASAHEFYLNPHPVGCALHMDPDCLCDVRIEKPVEVTCTPAFLVGVETADELVAAAADLWLRIDVLAYAQELAGPRDLNEERGNSGRNSRMETLNELDAQNCAQMVRDGKSFQEVRAQHEITERHYSVLRRMVNVNKSMNRIPAEMVVDLIDNQHKTLKQTREVLREHGVNISDVSSISRVYKRATGRSLAKRGQAYNTHQRQLRETMACELWDSGMRNREEIANVMTERGLPTKRSAVGLYIRRLRAA